MKIKGYHVQYFVIQTSFRTFLFCGPHTKPHGVKGLSKNYNMIFDPQLGHSIFAIRLIPCVCVEFTSTLEKPGIPGFPPQQQPRYQPVTYCTYWPVLGSFKNWNVITLSHKVTRSEVFEGIHQVFLDGIKTIWPCWCNILIMVTWAQWILQQWDTIRLSLS